MIGLESRQSGLELERLLHSFVNEVLDDLLAPRSESTTAEPAAKSTNPANPRCDTPTYRRRAYARRRL
jgi:hypothetical protein